MTPPLVTFITPISDYHAHLESAVRATVAAQTVACQHIVVHDRARRGAGFARNEGLRQVTTDYVCYLDADDTIAPDFVARCLAVRRRYHYVFTDIMAGSHVIAAQPYGFHDDGAHNTRWHAVTTLCPTAFWRAISGFDATLPAMEDTDAYMRLNIAGYCGQRLDAPLFLYGDGGARAASFNASPDKRRVMDIIRARHEGKLMGCCGGTNAGAVEANEKEDGDVLVTPTWSGNRRVIGAATGRLYPRADRNRQLWVNEADADAQSNLFQRVQRAADPLDVVSPQRETLMDFVNRQYPPAPLPDYEPKIVITEFGAMPPEEFERLTKYFQERPAATRSVADMSKTMADLAPHLGHVAPTPPHDAQPAADAVTMTRRDRARRVTAKLERGME